MADLFEIPLNETTLSLEFAVLISGLVLAREKTLVMLIPDVKSWKLGPIRF